jgi:hypothetical protein
MKLEAFAHKLPVTIYTPISIETRLQQKQDASKSKHQILKRFTLNSR